MIKYLRAWYYNTKYPFLKPSRNYYIWKIWNYHREHWKEAFTPIPLADMTEEAHKRVEEGKYRTTDLFTINKGKKKLAYKIIILDKFDSILNKCIPNKYTAFDWIPKGWKIAFGKQMCNEFKETILKDEGKLGLKKIRVSDIKEKYGTLQIDFNHVTPRLSKLLHKYEYISQFTCIVCGDLAVGETPVEYWKCPYCEKHKPENSKYFLYHGITYKEGKEVFDGPSWYGWHGNMSELSDEEYKKAQENFKEYNELKF